MATDLALRRNEAVKYGGTIKTAFTRGSKALAMWKSDDLVHWSDEILVDLSDNGRCPRINLISHMGLSMAWRLRLPVQSMRLSRRHIDVNRYTHCKRGMFLGKGVCIYEGWQGVAF